MTALELYRLGILLPISGGQGGLGGESGGEYGHAEGGLGGGFGGSGGGGGGGEGFGGGAPNGYSRADIGSGYATTPGGPGPLGFGGGSLGALGTGGFGPTGVQVATESAAATGAIQRGATFTQLVAPNPTTPSYTNLDVLTYGIQHPVIGRTIAKIGQAIPFIGGLLSGALALRGGNPLATGPTPGGGPEGSPTPLDLFYGGTAPQGGTAPSAQAQAAPGSVTDPLAALAGELGSLFGGGGSGGGGGAPPIGTQGLAETPITSTKKNALLLLLALALAAGLAYWYYRKHHRKAAS